MKLRALVVEKLTQEYDTLLYNLRGQLPIIEEQQFLSEQWMREDVMLIAQTSRFLDYGEQNRIAAIAFLGKNSQGEELRKARLVVEGFEEVDGEYLIRQYERYHGLPWFILETERTYLREQTMEDIPAIYRLYQGKGITDYLDPLFPEKEEAEYIRDYIHYIYGFYEVGLWLVIEKESGRIIGRAGFNPDEADTMEQFEMGYVIAADCQRQGIGEEVCRGMLEYAGKKFGDRQINCYIQSENRPSVCLAKKLGFYWKEEMIRGGKKTQRYCN